MTIFKTLFTTLCSLTTLLMHPVGAAEIKTITLEAQGTDIRVLLPDDAKDDQLLRVVYVLPVEAKRENRYGDGLEEVRKLDLANKYGVAFVAPSFAALPWYADHPSDPAVQQETYFLKTVLPTVEASFPISKQPEDRYLLGFSKSGWGAWSMLLRHPDLIDKAAAWDAPLAMTEVGKYGNKPIFGTQENFEAYRIDHLLKANAEKLQGDQDSARLILTGYGSFRSEHQKTHNLMEALKIPHIYRDGPQAKHHWNGGWVAEAVELLLPSE